MIKLDNRGQTTGKPSVLDQIRSATNGNDALGSTGFEKQVANALGRRVVPGKPGRPRKGMPDRG